MKTIVVTVDKGRVLAEVHRRTAYVGAKQEVAEGGVYDGLRTVKEDDALLGRLFASALTALFTQLSPWLQETTPALDILITVPSNFDFSQVAALRGLVEDYLINQLLSDWFALVAKEGETGQYDASATAQMDLIKATLNKRKRPLKPLYDEEHEIVARRHVAAQ